MIGELLNLERRVARGGHDSIDHPRGLHDDYINSAAGALVLAASGKRPVMITAEMVAKARMPPGLWRPDHWGPAMPPVPFTGSLPSAPPPAVPGIADFDRAVAATPSMAETLAALNKRGH